MPRLIALNGPPAAGKSTLAGRYVAAHPPALNLDIDLVRAQIGGDRQTAGRLAREIALAAARVHLTAGHDVIVPQLVVREEFLRRLEETASEAGAEFAEIVLLPSPGEVLRRFAERADPAKQASRAEVVELYDRLVALVPRRPRAKVVPSVGGEIDRTYEAVLDALG